VGGGATVWTLPRVFPMSWKPYLHSRFGDAAFVLFSVVQIIDGCLTYAGIRTYGVEIEANPIIRWYTLTLGTGVALVAAKMFAVMCGAVLHLTARHYAIGALTIGYLAVAISPWIHLLWR
jgi:uncharacterized protein DUF5658